MGEFLSVERRGKIAILTMIKPESMNAIGTHEDCRDIIDTLRALGDDRGVSAIILTGSGKAFSAGGNLKGMQDRTGIGVLDQPDSTRANYRKGVQAVIRALMDCEVPMIAAVNGHAIGLGCDLACTCDIRIASESAKFACSFIKVGIVPGDGGAWLLQKILGYPRAAELFLTGDRFDAATASSWAMRRWQAGGSTLRCRRTGRRRLSMRASGSPCGWPTRFTVSATPRRRAGS